ncbi:phage baseplate assembly protein [Craterilacuibacter sinensis]|uniref:Phage tail protein n=1 Tax=Craterilacuibacter sinensis TaxID=2686017 RepID=A0A845BW18_9NEIS|nr:phage tail protein [Craterilacuibacter sinensis]MXR36703.1 phage tail protein [Craterilacuibacter sinensis]
MPTPDNTVSLLIGGKVHSQWSSYEIDSDLLIPADAWRVELGLPQGQFPPQVTEGAAVQVRIGNDPVMTGYIDDIEDSIDKNSHTLNISGRDGAGVLVDCSSPVFTAKQSTLAEIVANVVKPLGISKIRIDAAKTTTRDKVNVEPGDTAWDTLVHAAEANGLWPWFEPDGTLVIGGPDYSKPPVASLVMRRDGKGNNLISLQRSRNMAERYSDITVLGQAHGTSIEGGKNALKSTVRDPGVTLYRPRIVVDHDAENTDTARARARKLLSDARLKGFTLVAKVKGHRTSAGLLWQPGQRIHVVSEPHGIDAVFFLMARKFQGGRSQGTTTTLTLKEDGVWVLDAHPHQRAKNRAKGRTKKGEELEIVDVG